MKSLAMSGGGFTSIGDTVDTAVDPLPPQFLIFTVAEMDCNAVLKGHCNGMTVSEP